MKRPPRLILALILGTVAGLAALLTWIAGRPQERAPGVASAYFPDRALAADGGDAFGAWAAGEFAGVLGRMDEPSLRADARADAARTAYRMVALPTWGTPVAVRFEEDRASATSCRRVTLDGEFDRGAIRDDLRGPLPRGDWDRLAAQVEAAGFWAMPGRLHPERVVTDGSLWLIEGVQGGRYHAVFCHSPPPGPFRDLGRALLDGVKPAPAAPRPAVVLAVVAAGLLALALGAAARHRAAQPRRTL